ncbi:hypothetical protein ARMGADRAFT_306480 [Armillaria gallica]|uniref:Uncharacterized protein n=1 Tax=Armillaria gallica TaxID=47427 RepID=A0A2H3DM48_ARMGA|nr:hypothetical protein ARMGADRAFT_306480 [Armillaria gallica]
MLAYPWRGTTPLVCIILVGLTILLVFVNIPLSAYDVVQEFTYSPNDTSQSPPFSNMIPTFLRHTAGDFTPQTFRVGDTIQIYPSVFTYVIVEALPDSFPYYNNPLSSCDVLNISLSLRKEESISFSATVSCWIPTDYKMTLNTSHASMQYHLQGGVNNDAIHYLDGIFIDLEYGWDSENVTLTSKNEGGSTPTTVQNVTGIDLSVFPCCVCTNWFNESHIYGISSQYDPLLYDHPPCDDNVAKFQATGMAVYYGQDGSFSYMNIIPGGNILPSDQELEVPSNVQLVLQNALQAIYSTIRVDLGVSPPNQIFALRAYLRSLFSSLGPTVRILLIVMSVMLSMSWT